MSPKTLEPLTDDLGIDQHFPRANFKLGPVERTGFVV